jgi:predicted N-acyltransferase
MNDAAGARLELSLRTHESIRSIGRARWNELCSPDESPQLSFEWLDALERTGCVGAERGWLPMHVTLEQGGEIVAAAPAYLKGNSEGEFVFDHSWARFAEGSLGIEYYPKLVVAVPFTPATGPRLLLRPGTDRTLVVRAFAQGLALLCKEFSASGAHVLFLRPEQAAELRQAGLVERYGVQFHWHNHGYGSFDDFLARFSSKHRNQIRRERREMKERSIELTAHSGSELTPELADLAYEFYVSTVDKFPWGRRYLKREFFEEIFSTMPERLHFVVARDASGNALGGAFNLLGKDTLFGRYWGASVDVPFLHFNVCFYFGIEECIRRGLLRFEPGAGGEHKLARGFEPTITHSVHYLEDARLCAAVYDYLARERVAVSEQVREAALEGRLKPKPGS